MTLTFNPTEEREEDLLFWSLQERGFYADPSESELPTYFEIALNPINRIEVQAR